MTQRSRPGGRANELSLQEALRRCMQQAPLPFAITRGADHKIVYANSAFSALAGVVDGGVIDVPIARTLIAAEGQALKTLLDRAYRDGVEMLDEPIEMASDGASRWYCSVWPVIADDQRVEALGIQIREQGAGDAGRDLQRQVAEQMLLGALRERGLADDAEAARRRAAFLAEAGRLLAESVDQSTTLVALTKLALPALGAWCIVDILEEGNTIHRLGIYHPDPEKQKLARELEASWAPEPEDPFGAPAMLRDPQAIAITSDIEATLAASAHTPQNLYILRQLGIGSLLTVPLIARKGKIVLPRRNEPRAAHAAQRDWRLHRSAGHGTTWSRDEETA